MKSRQEQTSFYDSLRAPFEGMLESAWMTLSLLIATRWFEASIEVKSLIAASGSIGLLLNPVSLSCFSHGFRTSNIAAASFFFISSFFLAYSIITESIVGFLVSIFASRIAWTQSLPFIVHLYTVNYPRSERGMRFSQYTELFCIGGILFGSLGGHLLQMDIVYYPLLYAIMVMCGVFNGFSILRIPSVPLESVQSINPLQQIALVWQDRVFGWNLLCWMFIGFANLMVIPIRVDYLADSKYGINVDNFEVMLLTLVIPTLARVLSSRIWGILFDRIDFNIWRALVNICFIASFIFYFGWKDRWSLYTGSVLIGIAFAGGNIGWTLWVTKLAPIGKAASYMSVHTFMTGIRGVIAPWFGFVYTEKFGISALSHLAIGLAFLSTVMFGFYSHSSRMK